jgi:hypothetical protein
MGEETQVLVRFTTRLPPELQVPATEVVGAVGCCCLLLAYHSSGCCITIPFPAGCSCLFEALWTVTNHKPLAGTR